ncbi:bacillithiol biosynthesis cysteine-adding enzyme BshC [Paenibacillus sp. B01]|uniref:bacillithiol biosynthesis cysteine-adding enzyme BshC n=1 Tax=Paenibacillus sp. B01 TaxID=2660554 RepID=UPI00129B6B34|nr:bacillithiol biosynthesis cysteine-adding enzyme BshC [Paenibacillus sp. B01]QGG56906.1 bacillithiol biosynthesis cysteine-adding enzyme BshC [Paenibacillus sp. B01]
MDIVRMELPFGQPLADAYIQRRDPALEALFGHHPADGSSWRRRLDYLNGSADRRAGSRELAGALRAFQQPLGISEAAERNLERLADGAPVVVGGQQAVLWTGPLMILYKAVTILQAADAASKRLGVPVVPVFWIAGEDHDWDEACLACLPSPVDAPELRRLSMPRPPGPATSVSRTRLGGSDLEAALTELEAGLADTPFKPELLRSLRARAAGCATLTELFAALLTDWLGESGLLLADADHPALRRLEGPMFRRLAESSGELAAAYAASTRRVEALGYKAQAEAAEDAANLFLFAEEPRACERLLLQRAGGRFRDRRGLVSLSEAELLELAEAHPERLSNNVLTRPLMQDYLFPVLSTVLGPGEIAYWAQTAEAFGRLGMQMPIVTPRLSFTLLEPHAVKTMARHSLQLEQVLAGLGGVKAELLDRQGAADIRGGFEQALQAMREAYRPALALAAGQERGLEELGRTNWERIAREIGYMQAKTLQALESRERTELDRLAGLELSAVPEGRPQERVLAAVYFMNRYGRGWLDRLLAEPYEPCAKHGVMRL